MGYTMEDFKAGKIAVIPATDEEAKALVARCKDENISFCGVCATPVSVGRKYVVIGNRLHARSTSFLPAVQYADIASKAAFPHDQLFIFRTADGITAVQKLDGKEVKRATVRRYVKDADDFLTGAAAALDKLRGEQKPVKYKVGDVVRVRSDLVANTRYGELTMWAGPMYDQLIGKNVKLSGHSRKTIWDAENGWFVDEAMFSHLVRRAHD